MTPAPAPAPTPAPAPAPAPVQRHSGEWTPDDIKALLMRNDKAVGRALAALLGRQTYREAATSRTVCANGVGFCAYDAAYMTGMARDFITRGYLTPQQLAFLRSSPSGKTPRICRYARQLAEIANNGHKAPPKEKH